jgi:hypothetical protein
VKSHWGLLASFKGGAFVMVAPLRSMFVVMSSVPAAVTGLLGRNPGCFLTLNPLMKTLDPAL